MNQWHDNLLRAADGQQEAIKQIIKDYDHVVTGVVDQIRLPAYISLRDVGQEVWSKAWLSIKEFDGLNQPEHSQAMFHNWLKITARRKALTIVAREQAGKRKPTGVQQELASDCAAGKDGTPSECAVANEEARLLARAIGQLEDRDAKKILQLRYDDGLTLAQIADRLDLGIDSVRYKLDVTLKSLQYTL
jgi:RNA polymerase sigma factor (sigma-70 family)